VVQKDLLKSVYLFGDLADEELSRLAAIGKTTALQTGDVLFREGDPATALYVVKYGSVRVKRGGRTDDHAVATLSAGSHFGELGFVDDSPRSAMVEAIERTELVQVDYADLARVLREHPAVAARLYRAMSRYLARRLRRTTGDLAVAREAGLVSL
jgi:CRP-like cAMP-binding protein